LAKLPLGINLNGERAGAFSPGPLLSIGREKGKVKLTRRQREFLSKFVDLYREFQKPLHYTQVARRLGIGNVTAYEMLRLLEERGLVTREYVITGKPGRSSVLFYPSREAFILLRQTLLDTPIGREWEEARAQIIRTLKEARERDFEGVMEQLLRHLPERTSPLLFMADLITAVMLILHRLRKMAVEQDFFKQLRNLGLPGEKGLNALAGLMFGLAMAERFNWSLSQALLRYSVKFQSYLAGMNKEAKEALAEFTGEIMQIIGI